LMRRDAKLNPAQESHDQHDNENESQDSAHAIASTPIGRTAAIWVSEANATKQDDDKNNRE
jgi:hypothetical protein